jgi:histone H3/H4
MSEFEEEFNEETEVEEKEIDTISEEEYTEDDEYTEDEEKLPFAKAEVVRLMKEHLDDDKMIRERVKVEMNKFLGDVLANVCKQLNEYPYSTVEYEMLKESTYPYTNIERINEEKIRILKHLDAIKADCDALSMDVKATLKLNDKPDTQDEDDLF